MKYYILLLTLVYVEWRITRKLCKYSNVGIGRHEANNQSSFTKKAQQADEREIL